MPDIIQRLKDAYAENHAKALKLLPELFQAADEGKIIVLPCKAGDTVYINDDYWGNCCKGYVADISTQIFMGKNRSCFTASFLSTLICKEFIRDFYSEDFGKTVFLTCESAEAALKEHEIR